MAETGLKLRTATPMGDWRSFPVTTTAAVVAGAMDMIHDTVGVYVETVLAVGALSDYGITKYVGDDVAFIYHAEKIMVPKDGSSVGHAFSKGDKVFYDATNKQADITGGGNLWIGICVKDAAITDTEVLIDLKGDKAS